MRYTHIWVLVLILGAAIYGAINMLQDHLNEVTEQEPSYYTPIAGRNRSVQAAHGLSGSAPRFSTTSSLHHSSYGRRTYTVPSELRMRVKRQHISKSGYNVINSSLSRNSSRSTGSTPTQGLYLTSSAKTHSYGGRTTGGKLWSTNSLWSQPLKEEGTAGTIGFYSITAPTQRTNESNITASIGADRPLAANTLGATNSRLRSRVPSIGGVGGIYTNWLYSSSLWGYSDGNMQLTIQELQDLYNAACLNDAEFAETHSFEDFLNWFIETQDTREGFLWHLPVGNSLIPLLILALLYVGYKCLRRTAQDKAA